MYAKFLTDILDELDRAREKFPSSDHMLLAIAEESGELVKAACDLRIYQSSVMPESTCKEDIQRMRRELYKECVQTVVTIARLIDEGDATQKIKPLIDAR